MQDAPSQSIDRRAIVLWRVSAAIQAVVNIVVASAAASAVITMTRTPSWMVAVGVAMVAIWGMVSVIAFPPLRWRLYRYQVGDEDLDIQSGVFIVRRTLVPLVRVQHVDTTQGPLGKYFGLSSVTVSTAATTHEIPALADELADELRRRIAALARVAREDD